MLRMTLRLRDQRSAKRGGHFAAVAGTPHGWWGVRRPKLAPSKRVRGLRKSGKIPVSRVNSEYLGSITRLR